MRFEWDELKSLSNLKKHGVSFNNVTKAFDNPMVVRPDNRFEYGEERLIGLGNVNDIVLVIVFTKRNKRIRLISSRKANKRERRIYFEKV